MEISTSSVDIYTIMKNADQKLDKLSDQRKDSSILCQRNTINNYSTPANKHPFSVLFLLAELLIGPHPTSFPLCPSDLSQHWFRHPWISVQMFLPSHRRRTSNLQLPVVVSRKWLVACLHVQIPQCQCCSHLDIPAILRVSRQWNRITDVQVSKDGNR